MSRELRIERYEGLINLVRDLAGEEFGGTPACSAEGIDPELFQPVSELARAQINRAKEICRGCPIQGSCLQHAMRRGEHGIWGGTTEGERRRLRTARADQDQQTSEITEGVQAA